MSMIFGFEVKKSYVSYFETYHFIDYFGDEIWDLFVKSDDFCGVFCFHFIGDESEVTVSEDEFYLHMENFDFTGEDGEAMAFHVIEREPLADAFKEFARKEITRQLMQ